MVMPVTLSDKELLLVNSFRAMSGMAQDAILKQSLNLSRDCPRKCEVFKLVRRASCCIASFSLLLSGLLADQIPLLSLV
jgi:hypothetical protein